MQVAHSAAGPSGVEEFGRGRGRKKVGGKTLTSGAVVSGGGGGRDARALGLSGRGAGPWCGPRRVKRVDWARVGRWTGLLVRAGCAERKEGRAGLFSGLGWTEVLGFLSILLSISFLFQTPHKLFEFK